MTKSITKKAKTTGRKRPKSVLQKAWETRRKNAKHRVSLEGQMNRAIFGDNADTSNLTKAGLASLVKGIPSTSETATPRSDAAQANGINPNYDPMAELSDMKRDYRKRQLCGFVADFQIIKGQRMKSDATPIMLSWEQARAISEFLLIEGYSPYGAPY